MSATCFKRAHPRQIDAGPLATSGLGAAVVELTRRAPATFWVVWQARRAGEFAVDTDPCRGLGLLRQMGSKSLRVDALGAARNPGAPNHQENGRLIMSKTELFEKGLKVRKEVLGEDYVNKSIAGADEFTRTMAEWSTEFCWGALWTRPGLDRKTRSLINLAMLSALGKTHELKLHVRGALTNGVTVEEIKEVLLQVAVYCGVPAGMDSFRNAREAIKEVQGK